MWHGQAPLERVCVASKYCVHHFIALAPGSECQLPCIPPSSPSRSLSFLFLWLFFCFSFRCLLTFRALDMHCHEKKKSMTDKLDYVIPPVPQAHGYGKTARQSPEGLTSSHRSGSGEESLWEDIVDLDGRVRALAAQQRKTEDCVGILQNQHGGHCDLLNALCADLGEYLEMESASSPVLVKTLTRALAQRRMEQATAKASAPPPPSQVPQPPPAPPREVVITAPPNNELAEKALVAARESKAAVERLEDQLAAQQSAFRKHLQETEERVLQQVESVRRLLETQIGELRDSVADRFVKQHTVERAEAAESHAAVEEKIRRVDHATTAALDALRHDMTTMRNQMTDACRQGWTDAVQPLQTELGALRRRAAEWEGTVSTLVNAPAPVFPDLTPDLERLNNRIGKIEASLCDTRDEYEMAAQKSLEREKRYLHLHAEVDQLTKALEIHTDAINEMQKGVSLEGPFNEVKDWLLDLEKRVMTRGEMLEVTQRFDTELADVRLELTKYAPAA